MTSTDALKSALWTALWTFVALFGLSFLSVLSSVASWASTSGRTDFPDLSVVAYAAVAAAAASVTGLLNYVIRYAQAKGIFGEQARAVGPNYSPTAADGTALRD